MPCRRAKEFLSSNGIPYEDINVAENAEAREELIRRTEQLTVPLIIVDEEIVIGFDRGRLQRLLGL